MTAEPLLPAEAALLIETKRSAAGKCLKAALLTLLGRGHIAIEEEGRFFKQRFLWLKEGDGEKLPRHLATIKNSLEVYAVGGRLKSNLVVRALQMSFGNDFRRYVHDVLAPPLISRGLIKREERRFLGLIPYAKYERTLSGDAKAGPLLRLLDEASGLRKLIRNDPDRAIRIAQAAGVLLVLSPQARAQIPRLKALIADRSSGGDGGGYYADSGTDESPSSWELGVDLGAFDMPADMGGMLDGIGSVGDFTGGDGGDGGGDGGGGD